MNSRFISWAIFIILCFIWGSSFILMHYSARGLSSAQIASVRILAAGLVFLPFAVFHLQKIPRNKVLLVIAGGITGNLLPAYLFAEAISRNIDSSLAGILNSLTPICVIVVAVLFFKDKVKRQKIAGVLVGFAGLVLLTLTQDDISLQNAGYASLILLGTICYGINVNLYSHYLRGLNAFQVSTVSLAFMIIPTAIVLWQQQFMQLDFAAAEVKWAVMASAALGVVGSALATILFYILVQKAGGLFASLVTYGIPFVALFWGFLDGEKITLAEISCLGLILFGVYLANRPDRKKDDLPVSRSLSEKSLQEKN